MKNVQTQTTARFTTTPSTDLELALLFAQTAAELDSIAKSNDKANNEELYCKSLYEIVNNIPEYSKARTAFNNVYDSIGAMEACVGFVAVAAASITDNGDLDKYWLMFTDECERGNETKNVNSKMWTAWLFAGKFFNIDVTENYVDGTMMQFATK